MSDCMTQIDDAIHSILVLIDEESFQICSPVRIETSYEFYHVLGVS